VPESPFAFELDFGHVFEQNRPEKVCGNTALMLSRTRLRNFFEITGSFDNHLGAFRDCGTIAAPGKDSAQSDAGSACC
jgi:hypothetical protein